MFLISHYIWKIPITLVPTGTPPRGGTGRTMLQATSFCERLPPTLFYLLRLVERLSVRDLWVTHNHLLYCCVCLIGCGSGGPPLDRRGVRAIQQQPITLENFRQSCSLATRGLFLKLSNKTKKD